MDTKKIASSVLALLLMLALVLQPLALAVPADATYAEETTAPVEEMEVAGTVIFQEEFETSDGEIPTPAYDDGENSDRDTEPTCYDLPLMVDMVETPSPRRAARSVGGSGIPHLYAQQGVVRSSGEATGAAMRIDRVRVLDGGENQARWRDQVGAGHSVYQGDSGNWYTTSRAAALDDRRVFYFHIDVPATFVAEALADPATFANRASVTYGGVALTVWRSGNTSFTGNADLIELASRTVIEHDDGSATLEVGLQFNTPYAAGAGVNAPGNADGGWRNFGQGGFPLGLRPLLGTFDVGIRFNNIEIGSMPLRLNLYDDFMQWYEIDQWAQDLQAEAGENKSINGRHVDVNVIGHSLMGRPIWNVAIAADQAAVDHYLNVTLPLMRDDPDELRRQIEAGVHHRMAIYMTNIHPDEVSGVCSQLVVVEQLIHNDEIFFEYATETETIWETWRTGSNNNHNRVQRTSTDTNRVVMPVADVLDDFIILFCPTNNPDGREGLRRVNAYGFDMNRDGSSQVHPENRYMITEILRWSPIIQLDLHGHVAALLIEPCTAPHNPNYEYDLMRPMMVRLADAMGHAAIAGPYNRFMIPAVHRQEGWDDAGPLYLPVFMSHFGILGFTLEIPHANQESADANLAMIYAAINYASREHNFNEIVSNKLTQMHRGVNNIDARESVDPYFVDTSTFAQLTDAEVADGDPRTGSRPTGYLGRPRIHAPAHPQACEDGYLDFFPDWWVIPADEVLQYNRTEAYRGVENLIRQQIHVDRLTAPVTHDGVTYPAGTFVVDMRQSFRGAANTLLGYGYDASFSSTIYAGVLSAHPTTRGFAATPLWAENLFTDYLAPLPGFTVPATVLASGDSEYLVIRNKAQDTILVVNDLLRAGVDVWMLTEFAQGGRVGDFVVARTDLTGHSALEGRRIDTTGYLNEVPATAGALVQPNVAVQNAGLGAGQGTTQVTRYIVNHMLGFDMVTIEAAENVIDSMAWHNANIMVTVNALNPAARNWLNDNQIPFVIMGNSASNFDAFFGPGAVADNIANNREGIFRGGFSATNALTAHWDRNNLVHSWTARAYTAIPDGTVPLIHTDAGAWEDVFLGGWFNGVANQNNATGRILAFTGTTEAGTPGTLFGTNITRFAHIQKYYGMLGTAILMHTAGIPTDVSRPYALADTAIAADGLEVTLNYFASEVTGNTATVTERWVNVSPVHHIPPFNAATAAADGWVLYTGPITIDPAVEIVHWYVVNSEDATHQGYFNFGVHVEVEAPVYHAVTFGTHTVYVRHGYSIDPDQVPMYPDIYPPFFGWSLTPGGDVITDWSAIIVTGPMTFYAVFGSTQYEYHAVTFSGHMTIYVRHGYSIDPEQVPESTALRGWALTPDGDVITDWSTIIVTGPMTLYPIPYTPPEPQPEFHPAYMFGDPTGNFLPSANITRAQVAAILARTMIDGFVDDALPEGMDSFDAFNDVNEDNWFYYYVAWAY
ncbi:MAG: S-layer homology domain-containing protein, partial [Oscillospiraceae bacterium]|nr:S-layer homology domain-containing protein [Oscillospiraceae bacterium]